MAATPERLVHWALDASVSEFGSPFSEGTSSESSSSTSSLQYINSQLIAHGFTHNPGLSLEGLQKEGVERVVKCLLGMLGQRINDMSRTEDLSTKIRTLSYEHERLMSMYKTATDKAASAEREMSTHKARLASTTLSLQNTENAHKRTTAELQRLRTSLQGLRAQHLADVKKIEREKDRVMERWSKLADNQVKLNAVASGISFANSQVVEASDVQLRGKGQGFLEISLEQAERSRNELADETRNMRGLVLSTANELQRILYNARKLSSSENIDEPAPIASTTLFPLAPANAAHDKLFSLLAATKELTERLTLSQANPPPPANSAPPKQEVRQKEDRAELGRLQNVVKTLRAELDKAQKQSASYATQAQEVFDRFAADKRLMQGCPGEVSVDLMTAPAKDEEKELLNRRCQDLEEDRRKFTEAAVKLGKEKAVLEAERIRFLEEKRSWQVEKMLDELPPTPVPSSSTDPPPVLQEADGITYRSPRKSPRKVSHKARSSGALTKADKKTTRVARRSSGLGLLSPKQTKVIPAFETEVIPSSSTSIPEFKLSMTTSQGQALPMTSAFVLPPPSPAASFAPQEALLSSAFAPPIPKLDIPQPMADAHIRTSYSDDISTRPTQQTSASTLALPESSSAPVLGTVETSSLGVPRTPSRRPFPMAKPLAQRMIHAYSPVKPSPLSRILMLANSPESPEGQVVPSLGSLSEENESPDTSPTPAAQPSTGLHALVQNLATEPGGWEDDIETVPPLREKPSKHNNPERKASAKDQGKARADDRRSGTSKLKGSVAVLEKENKVRRSKTERDAGLPSVSDRSKAPLGAVKKTSRSTIKSNPTAVEPKIVPKVKGGARRVPIDSAEAAVVAPAWKG